MAHAQSVFSNYLNQLDEKERQFADCERETQLLIARALSLPECYALSRFYSQIARPNLQLDENQTKYFLKILQQRFEQRVPLDYLLGSASFYGRDFDVSEHVLVPRADTGTLIEAAKKLLVESIASKAESKKSIRVLDIGTGSGCIPITLLLEVDEIECTAIDKSSDALRVAQRNAQQLLGTKAHNLELRQEDVFDLSQDFSDMIKKEPFDMVISNPPYIRSAEIASLQAEVQHEPRMALDGGTDGLDFYRTIKNLCSDKLLAKNGYLLFEIGYDQAQQVTELLLATKRFRVLGVEKDLGNNDRVVIAQKLP